VYRLPLIDGQCRYESLGNVIIFEGYRELLRRDLGDRLRALAWTMFELHSVDWVHGSLHPDNILLFGEEVFSLNGLNLTLMWGLIPRDPFGII
jgi:tRNA A-37 threonylcarbamoyl transferase component Bud32